MSDYIENRISTLLAFGVMRLHIKNINRRNIGRQRASDCDYSIVDTFPSEGFSTGLLNHVERDCTVSKTSQGLITKGKQ